MGYTYAIMPDKMFEDRFEEFVTLGTPRSDVEEMRKRITDMWADARGAGLTNGQHSRRAMQNPAACTSHPSRMAARNFHALRMTQGFERSKTR